MGQYYTSVNATTNTVVNTEDTFIELLPPASVTIRLKRICVSFTGTPADNAVRVQVKRVSAAGATGTAGTIAKKSPTMPAAVSTSTIKNGTTAFTVGTLVDKIFDRAINTRGLLEWIPRDENDIIESNSNQRIAITLACNVVSQAGSNVEVEWVE